MQRLPDFLMLDFCEWIKRVILSKAQYSNIDMWDLLFDEKYEKLLLKKAKEYCNKERKQKNAYSNDNIKKIINELAKKENIDENLKQNNQLEWVRCMNNIKNKAEEIVLNELIYC